MTYFLKKIYVYVLSFLTLACGENSVIDSLKETSQVNPNLEEFSIGINGETRTYWLHIPENYDENDSMPVVLNFHGFGGRAEEYASYADMVDLSDSEGFLLVYPQGSLLDGSPHWNAALDSSDNKSDAEDLEFIDILIRRLSDDYKVDLDRVYACGYSNGGFFSFALACYRSDLIAAVGSISGSQLDLGETCSPTHSTPVISFHGTSDSTIPYDGNSFYFSVEEILNYWVSFNETATNVEVAEYQSRGQEINYYNYSDGNNGVSVNHYQIIGGGHIWFDLDINGQNTGELLWEFFDQYDINGKR